MTDDTLHQEPDKDSARDSEEEERVAISEDEPSLNDDPDGLDEHDEDDEDDLDDDEDVPWDDDRDDYPNELDDDD